VLLGALIAAFAATYLHYALRLGNFQNDEEQYMQLARYIAGHFPGALTQSGIYPRGTQRLDPIILAIPFSLMRGPGAYQLGHVLQCLLFTSTALPVFLLARRAGLGLLAGLFAATLSICVPWAVVATTFLAESLAYPAFAWVIFTTWMVMRHPSTWREVLALLALAVAALSRTALLALAPVLPLAVLWHEWSWELAGRPWRARARALPARLWSRHRLLTLLAAAGLLALLAGQLGALPGHGLSALAGDYGLPHVQSVSSLIERYSDYLSRMAAGTGFLAVVVALPWTLGTLISPRDGNRHATAVLCVLGIAAILLSLLEAGPDERYILYGAIPISLATATALTDWSELPRPSLGGVLGVLLGVAVVVLLLDRTTWPSLANAFDFFTYPAAIFYQRVLLTRAGSLHVPLHPSPEHLVEAGVIVVTLAFLAAGLRRGWCRPAAALLGAALIVLCTTQTIYNLHKFIYGAGNGSGPDASERSWVDEHVPSSARVGALALSLASTPAYVPIWRETEYWNTSVSVDDYFSSPGALPFPLGISAEQLSIQPYTGILSAHTGPAAAPLPPYLLIPLQGTNSLGIEGHVVAPDPYLPLQLIRLPAVPRVDWALSGTSEEGWMAPRTPVVAQVYAGALLGSRPNCASFSLIAPPEFKGRWPYTVLSAGRVLARGLLMAQQTQPITVPLSPVASPQGTTAGLTVHVDGSVPFVDGLPTSARVAFFNVAACPAHAAHA
jgi:hypothetical protein